MLFHIMSLVLSTESQSFAYIYIFCVMLVCLILPFVFGQFLAKRLRMQDYAWKIGVIVMTLLLAGEVLGRTFDAETGRFNIKLGVDLQGGVILIYEVEEGVAVPAGDGQAVAADADTEGSFRMASLIEALSRRINPSGTKEIVIRPYGDRQVEIIIPEVDQREVELIKKGISTAGVLQFRIVANPRDHSDVIDAAKEMAREPITKRSRIVRDEDGTQIGLWARVAREQAQKDPDQPFKLSVVRYVVRDASSGEILTIPATVFDNDEPKEIAKLQGFLDENDIKEIDVLMATNDTYDVTGVHLGSVSRGSDELLNPCINFNLKGEGIDRFANLTREYAPSGQFQRQLGIVLDNELLSAPNIREMIVGRGRITGKFTKEEVDFMVNILQAGSLPVVLHPVPISENIIDPLLGQETIEQGKIAITTSLLVVLTFILIYYRFAGFVACLALIANLVFIMALMVMIKAAFTLPGLAGLVLTVGMSVDANVLIFERIREELKRGAALRMAIRNGFGRATTTIIDANVTTLITAIVLYAIGTDQIRGFAVTLILGILMSMFTAIFCSRVIFDIAERTRRVTQLGMAQLLGATQIDFIGKRRLAAVASIILICIGIAGLWARGADIFDIDFRGGTSVHVKVSEPMETEVVRSKLGPKFDELGVRYTLTAMNNQAAGNVNDTFKVDSAIPEVEELQQVIQDTFRGPDGESQLATYSLNYGDFKEIEIGAAPDAAPDEAEKAGPAADKTGSEDAGDPSRDAAKSDKVPIATDDPATKTPSDTSQDTDSKSDADAGTPPAAGETKKADAGDGASNDLPGEDVLALATAAAFVVQASTGQDAPTTETPETGQTDAEATDAEATDAKVPDTEVTPAGTQASDDAPGTSAEVSDESEFPEAGDESATDPEAASESRTQIEVQLEFAHGINEETLRAEIEDAADALGAPVSYFELLNPEWQGGNNAFDRWTLRISESEEQTKRLLDHLKAEFAETPVWPSSSKIGGQVADSMQNKAIGALLFSLLGIIAYIWIRFQRVIFGLAAVVALVHDVLIVLGAIALSHYVAGALGFLLVEDFKISLPIVAALLTIMGYSLNDTIVVFDRIREVRGKSPDLTSAMINKSINQTLSRTLLTSMTTLIVVLILYAIGGQGIHGFAFALVIGVLVGTYSSIFIASPVLLWMTGPSKSSGGKATA